MIAVEEYGADFEAGMGAEAIKELLKALDPKTESTLLREQLAESTSETKPKN